MIAALALTACSTVSGPEWEPLTKAQKDFLRIRTLEEKGKSTKLVEETERFLRWYGEPELTRPVLYYRARHLARLGRDEEARKIWEEIARRYPDTRWAVLARHDLANTVDLGMNGKEQGDG
jgi:hypothetical protein